jgi:hypothetical protein
MSKPLRSAQAITPFGVGAMVDFPGPESLIHAGLDAWEALVTDGSGIKSELRIDNEPALARRLGVDFFVTPPLWVDGVGGLKLPFLRFPRFHSCPVCGKLTDVPLHAPAPKCRGYGVKTHTASPMQQMRFVAACRSGHLRDFPWLEWLSGAESNGSSLAQLIDIYRNGGWLRIENTGVTGGQGIKVILGSLSGSAETIVASRTLASAFGGDPMSADDTPLARLGIKCRSDNPALGISPGHELCTDCPSPLVVLLRGSGNLYFSDIESAIYVPEAIPGNLSDEARDLFESDALVRALLREAGKSGDGKLSTMEAVEQLSIHAPHVVLDRPELEIFVRIFNELEPARQLKTHPDLSERIRQFGASESPISPESLISVLKKISLGGKPLERWDCVPSGLSERVQEWLDDLPSGGGRADESTVYAKRHEFDVFCLNTFEAQTLPRSILKLRSYPVEQYGSIVKKHFEHIGLVDSLRETRVLKGFSRIYATQKHPELYRNLMSRTRMKWLPATMVFGEGIFFRFSMNALESWEEKHKNTHEQRLAVINNSLEELAERRQAVFTPVTPRFALVHTFAHSIINQMVFDSGYGASSLRERIYVSESKGDDPGMAGMLIYTAAGDSEGSMGGLVRLGEPGILEGVISRALENSMWCSSDPVCIESTGQGPDSCNLAACHSCGLLPETSCEHQNRMLDRGVMIGTLNHPEIGYFSPHCRRAE